MYAKGFEEALEHLRQSEPPGSNDLAAANTLATLSTASVGPAAGRSLEVHRSLPESHRSLDAHKSLPEAQQQNQGFPSLSKPPPIRGLLREPLGRMTLRPTRFQK